MSRFTTHHTFNSTSVSHCEFLGLGEPVELDERWPNVNDERRGRSELVLANTAWERLPMDDASEVESASPALERRRSIRELSASDSSSGGELGGKPDQTDADGWQRRSDMTTQGTS